MRSCGFCFVAQVDFFVGKMLEDFLAECRPAPSAEGASARAKRPPWGRPLRCGAGGGKGEKSLQRAARVWRKGLAGAPATPAHLSSLRAAARARAKGQTDMFLFPML